MLAPPPGSVIPGTPLVKAQTVLRRTWIALDAAQRAVDHLQGGRVVLAVGLALALSLGLSGTASSAPPPVATDPVVASVIPAVATDPVARIPAPFRSGPPSATVPVATTGTALTGTYVGSAAAGYRYLPAFQYQLVYSDPQGGYSCTAYAAAMAIDAASYGGDRISGSQVRQLSPAYAYTGLTLPDAIRAAANTHVVIVNKSGSTWDDLVDALQHGRGVVLQLDYDQIPDQYSGQPSFDGNHAVFVDYLHSTGLWLYVMDPLSKSGPRWIPVSIMRKAAEKLGRTMGIYPGIYFAVTRTTRLFQ